MIVVDVGCATYGGDSSIPYLIDEFKPKRLYGFDPAVDDDRYTVGETTVVLRKAAAWTYEGLVPFTVAGLRGAVDRHGDPTPCFDLVEFIRGLPSDQEVVLKLDCEGGEYVLLPRLHVEGVDARLKLIWAEWHCPKCGTGWFTADDLCGRCGHSEKGKRSKLERMMECEMHQWNR